ncbi:ATP-binding cassette domain-containing protein [Pedobacter sp. L105]|uniref:ABC transporter ATP-binding protein n=1 Tax=Pedobacter sp. L105 TaxID=1641871 RepID=UPI00131A823D|nr:ABC transporter ATP-binding protein [Pedobacter sp. L105]
MIDISNLSFGYSNKHLLYKNLSLSIQNGNIYGLLGKNGAGKSTLLKNIAGILFPTDGNVTVDEMNPKRRNPSFLRTVYYIPEEVYVPALTIKQYLSLFAVFYPNFNVEQLHKYLKELEVEVPGKLNALSFGQQKKFIIAFGLACNTKVILMDEPTNGLDIPSKSQFRKLIASVMTEERIIFISTHQTRDLENLIDQVIIVDNGQLLLHASIEEISQKLYFETVSVIPANNKILYRENDLKGTSIVRENLTGEDSRINLEYLFNGVTAEPQLTKEIFQNN